MGDALIPSAVRALTLSLLVVLGGTAAYGQCNSNASSCVTCHETQGLRPVIQGTQPWHVGHGFGDLCVSCHGGERAEREKERSHAGLRQPMSDTALSCGGCHPDDTAARVQRYVEKARALAAAEATKPPPHREHSPVGNLVLGAACLGLAGAIGVVLKKRGLPREPLRLGLRDPLWNPVLSGALLGVVVAVSEVFFARPVGVSGAFDTLAAYAGRELFPHSQYYAYLMKPAITVQVWVVIGLFAGSFAASALSGQLAWRWLPDSQWTARFGTSRLLRLAVAFFSAVLVQLGAAIAGGCTSGLAISGGAVMAPAAFVFMAGMFAGGIPAAWLWFRRRGSAP